MNVTQDIRGILAGEKDFKLTPSVRDDDSLIDAGVVDSFGMIAFVVLLEQRFGIKVEPEDLSQEHFRSIASIARYVEGKLGGGARG